MIFFIIFAVCVVLQAFNLAWAQRRKEKKRVAMGLPEKIVDRSMDVSFKDAAQESEEHPDHHVDENEDMTDAQNPYFT